MIKISPKIKNKILIILIFILIYSIPSILSSTINFIHWKDNSKDIFSFLFLFSFFTYLAYIEINNKSKN